MELININFLKQILLFLFFMFLFWSAGKLVLRDRIYKHCNSMYLDFFFSSIIGISIVILYVSIISILGIAYKPMLYAPLLLLYGIKFFNYKNSSWNYMAVLLLVFLPLIILTLYPPTHWDDISYHLPIAQSIIDNAGLTFNQYIRYPVFPVNAEIFFTFGLVFGENIPQLLSCLSLFVVSIGLFGYIERVVKTKINGLIVFSILLSSQLLVFLSSLSYVDMLLTTFITSGILSLILYFESKDITFMYLSGISFGVAVGIKYTALIICLIAGLIFIIAIFLYKNSWKDLVIYILVVAVIGLPWYIRTFFYTGNPVWPFMNSIFGYSDIWNDQDYLGQFNDFEVNGVAKNFTNIIKIPIYLSTTQAGSIALNPFIWFGIIIFIFYMKKQKTHFLLLMFTILYTVSWFLSVNLIRYYALIIPIVSLVSALGLIYFIDQLNDKKIRYTVFIIVIFVFLSSPYNFIKNKVEADGLPPSNNENSELYLSIKLPTYQATVFARNLEGNTYGFLNENLYYYGKGKIIGDWFGKARYSIIFNNIDKENQLYDSLKELNVNNLLVNKLRLTPEQLSLINYQTKFTKIYEDNNAIVYQLVE